MVMVCSAVLLGRDVSRMMTFFPTRPAFGYQFETFFYGKYIHD